MKKISGPVEPLIRKMTECGTQRLISNFRTNPTPTAEPSFSGKAKKVFLVGFLLGGASFALLVPVLASASFFSSFLSNAAAASTSVATDTVIPNSQTLSLLSPAKNIDPSPSSGGGDIVVIGGSALLAQEGPSGTAADIESRPPSSQISVYTVRDGDSLASIAKMFGVSVNTILGANDIQGRAIHTGESLMVLPITGVQHTVRAGETLAGLAKSYSSDVHDIAVYNSLPDGADLAVGSSIIIPNGEATAIVAGSATTPSKSPKKVVLSPHKKLIAKIAAGTATEPYLGGSGASVPGYFAWPVGGGLITQGLHGWNGVDIGAPRGTAIFASAAGTVLVAKNNNGWNGGYGNYVVIAHDNGTQTLYAHMSKVLVVSGAEVTQGDTIGQVGMTGEATGNHLHFEVRGAKNPFASLSLGSSD